MFLLTPYELVCKAHVSLEDAEEVHENSTPGEWAEYCENAVMNYHQPDLDLDW